MSWKRGKRGKFRVGCLLSVSVTMFCVPKKLTNEIHSMKYTMHANSFAHFFEHAMFRGSSNISQQEFQATYQEMGARYNAWYVFSIASFREAAVSMEPIPLYHMILSSPFAMFRCFDCRTNPDSTNYYNNFPKLSADGASNLDTVLMVESDRFKYSNYTEEDFKIEAGAILGEFNGQQGELSDNLCYVLITRRV